MMHPFIRSKGVQMFLLNTALRFYLHSQGVDVDPVPSVENEEAASEPTFLDLGVSERRVAVLQDHGIDPKQLKKIAQFIREHFDTLRPLPEKKQYVISSSDREWDLYIAENEELDSGFEAIIPCPSQELGAGAEKVYFKGIDFFSLKVYAMAIDLFSGKEGVVKKAAAEKLACTFAKVGRCDSIVTLFHVFKSRIGEIPSTGFCFELAEEGSLESYLETHTLTKREVRRIALDVAKGLAHLHSRELCHYDIKPANILLTRREGAIRALVADLGFAGPKDSSKERGTLWHFPPEYWACFPPSPSDLTQLDGRRFDMWAYGDLAFFLTSGDHYIAEKEVGKIEAAYQDYYELCLKLKDLIESRKPLAVPVRGVKTLEDLTSMILQHDPKRRPESMKAIVSTIENLPLRVE